MTEPDAESDENPRRVAHVVGCAVRGPKHETADEPCQDGWAGYRLPNARFVLAVADGLGSASHSHHGADAATRAVAAHLRDAVAGVESVDGDYLSETMNGAFAAARDAVEQEADERARPVSELNTTLLALTAGPFGVAGAAVGDGGVVRHYDGTTQLLVPREDVTYSNQTTPLQSDRWTESYRFSYAKEVDAAVVFSDGLDPFVWDDRESVRETFFQQVIEHVRSTPDPHDARDGLREFLNDDHFRTHSRDDKSVVVGVLLDGSGGVEEPSAPEPVHHAGGKSGTAGGDAVSGDGESAEQSSPEDEGAEGERDG